jgi:hypothetical protein
MRYYISELLKLFVAKRAQYRCEYYHLQELDAYFKHQIEHIISRKHGGETIEENLAYACADCNSNKGTDLSTVFLPDFTLIRLFNPRRDDWDEHFYEEDSVIYAKTKVGEATIKVLKINDVDRIIERRLFNSLSN